MTLTLHHTGCCQSRKQHLNFGLCVMKRRVEWTSYFYIPPGWAIWGVSVETSVWLISYSSNMLICILPLSLTGYVFCFPRCFIINAFFCATLRISSYPIQFFYSMSLRDILILLRTFYCRHCETMAQSKKAELKGIKLMMTTPHVWFVLNSLFTWLSRHSQVGQMAYHSRQSLSSPSPGGTEMDLLVMRERPRRGIRNSGYDVSHM